MILKDDLKKNEEEAPLSLCYVGGVTTEKENKDSPYACHLELAKACKKNKCHYHLYAMGYSEERFADYIKCEETNSYFHLHKPVSHEQMIKEISKYDYGIVPIKSIYRQIKCDGFYCQEKYIYAGTNKYFDYLQAGLPVIALTPILMTQEIVKYCECVLLWSIEEYDFEYLRVNKEDLKRKCIQNRHLYDMDNQILRLLKFYESVRK